MTLPITTMPSMIESRRELDYAVPQVGRHAVFDNRPRMADT